jgi:hypothetical protein
MKVAFGYDYIKKTANLYYKRLNGFVNPVAISCKLKFAPERIVWYDDEDHDRQSGIEYRPGHSDPVSIFIDPNALVSVQSTLNTHYIASKAVTEEFVKTQTCVAILHELCHLNQYFSFYKYSTDSKYAGKVEAANDQYCRYFVHQYRDELIGLFGLKAHERLVDYYEKPTPYMLAMPSVSVKDYEVLRDESFMDKVEETFSPLIGITLNQKLYKYLLKNRMEGILFTCSINRKKYPVDVANLYERESREHYLLSKWMAEHIFDQDAVWGIKCKLEPQRRMMVVMFKCIGINTDKTGMECDIISIDEGLEPFAFKYK